MFVQPLDVEASPIKLMLRKEFHEQRYFILLSIQWKNFSIQIPSKISTEQIKKILIPCITKKQGTVKFQLEDA